MVGSGAKEITEEMYRKNTPLEHILLRPDTHVGSVVEHTQMIWVYEEGAMVKRRVTYVPALYKIFDEILVNAADNKQRDPSMDSLQVDIDVEGCCISVYNNGDGIPVEIHQQEGIYVPELFFGHLFYDNERKITRRWNVYGVKLTNIFSTEFVIEIADGPAEEVFYENMGKKSEPEIKKCKQSENWTRVTFKPDLAKFNMTKLEDDVVALMRKRVVDMAGTLGKTVKVELNGQKVATKSFSEYVQLYTDSASKGPDLPRNYQKVYLRYFVWIAGRTHVDYVADQIANYLRGIVNRKNKHANMNLDTAKGYLWVFVNALIEDPAFDSPTKETLITRQGKFGSKCELSEVFLEKVAGTSVVNTLRFLAESKLSKEGNLDSLPHSSTPMQYMQAPPRPTQIFLEIHGVHHRETKKRDHDDVFLERYLKLKREEIDRFAAIEEKKLEYPCSITKCITTTEKLQGLQVDDILVAADIFKRREKIIYINK
uniref:DNA topoisomerase 2 n=1 Tax=Aegilops tauschii TaxID=37682 RepID=N1QQ66_AEGTA